MKSRYSKTHSRDRIHDFSKSNNLINTDKQINIQIFNITSRARNKLSSKPKKDISSQLDDIIHLSHSKQIKRGSSNLSKRSKQKSNNSNQIDKSNNKNSAHGPITPNYSVVKKKQLDTSSQRLREMNNSGYLGEEGGRGEPLGDELGVEDIHYQMVRFQQRCKQRLLK